jgi:hypothetical protein
MRRLLLRATVAAVVLAGFAVSSADPAAAFNCPSPAKVVNGYCRWHHPLGTESSFYAPGPPFAQTLTGCVVTTYLGKDPSGDYVILTLHNSYVFGRNCEGGFVHLETVQGSRIVRTTGHVPAVAGADGDWSVFVRGPLGQPIVGALFFADCHPMGCGSWYESVFPV